MTHLKTILSKISKGIATIFHPVARLVKPGGKFYEQRKGAEQIVEGFKFMLGKTEQQKLNRLFDSLMTNVQAEDKESVRLLLQNSAALHQADILKIPLTDYLKIVVESVNRLKIHNFVGVKPMDGSVGFAHFLRIITPDPESPKQMRLEIQKQTVEANTRRLQARFNGETMVDLKALDVDFATELSKILGMEVASEINNEFVHQLVRVAKQEVENADEALIFQINRAACEIARRTRRGAGNFAIVTPEALEKIRQSSAFVKVQRIASEEDLDFVGIISGSIKVYVKRYHSALKGVLVGYRGGTSSMFGNSTDSGMTYCPYVPVSMSGIIVDPHTFQPQVSVMTRYGIAMLSEEDASNYYVHIK